MMWYVWGSTAIFFVSTINVFYWVMMIRKAYDQDDVQVRRRIMGHSFVAIGVWQLTVALFLILQDGWNNVLGLIGMGLILIFVGRHPRILNP